MRKLLGLVFRNVGIIFALLQLGNLCSSLVASEYTHDLIIIGEMCPVQGLGKIAWTLYDSLHDALKIEMIDYQALNQEHLHSLCAKVVLCTTQRGETNEHPNFCDFLPPADITIAYSVLETSRAPQHWVERFNNYFDAVIVADEFLVAAYQESGITTPIFVLPHGCYLERFMRQPQKKDFGNPFVFGMSGAFHQARKNPELLVKGFFRAFENRADVRLKIHTKGPWTPFCDALAHLIQDLKATNISFDMAWMSEDNYIAFLKSLDCYVLVSSGEGYSITPREALALGIPCVLSDTTSHKTICRSGFVCGVPCTIGAPGIYPSHPVPIGIQYSPTEEDVATALREVYYDKDKYLALAQDARPWLEQYCDVNLAPRFLTVCKPQEVILGDQNNIGDKYLMTTSDRLYKKYKKLMTHE